MSNQKADNILNSAKKLVMRYGYDKTSVSDIASEAGVSKGGIYLYFKGKDEIFNQLIIKEMFEHNEKWIELVKADPEGGLLHGMYRNQLRALVQSDFMMSIFKKDVDILGSFIKKQGSILSQSESGMRKEFVQMLYDVNCVKKGVDPTLVAHVMDMLGLSLLTIVDHKGKENAPPIEDVIGQIAYIMEKAYMPDDGGDSEAGKMVLLNLYNTAKQEYMEEE